MLGKLTEKESLEILDRNVTGRLGCHADGTTYVVPLNYVCKDLTIFAHSGEGRKVEMMRKNPMVCFEVDEIKDVFNWKSVIAWGKFEEIDDIDEKQQVMQRIIHRIMPLAVSATDHPSHGITDNDSDVGTSIELIVYKIVISELSGRYENSEV